MTVKKWMTTEEIERAAFPSNFDSLNEQRHYSVKRWLSAEAAEEIATRLQKHFARSYAPTDYRREILNEIMKVLRGGE